MTYEHSLCKNFGRVSFVSKLSIKALRDLDGPASMPRTVAYGQESSLTECATVVKIFIINVINKGGFRT